MQRLLKFVRTGRGLSAYASVVLGWMVLVILWGAVVRATGSGATVGPFATATFIRNTRASLR